MKYAYLHRLETGDHGTFGRILFDGTELFTGEQPWLDNKPNRSCIPAGLYKVLWTHSPAFGRMMHLVNNVPGRSGIRIHPANLMGDRDKGFRSHLYGCIALGEKAGSIEGQKAILVSRPAVRTLEKWAAGETFELEIVNGFS